jgi:large subunit ribosomal protein L29
MAAIAELRECDDAELETRLSESKQELFNLRFQLATGQLDNFSRISQVRKDVARLKTVLREREIEAAEAIEREVEAAPTDPGRPGRRRAVRASKVADAAVDAAEEEDETEASEGETEDG